jgi:hypothetical protein
MGARAGRTQQSTHPEWVRRGGRGGEFCLSVCSLCSLLSVFLSALFCQSVLSALCGRVIAWWGDESERAGASRGFVVASRDGMGGPAGTHVFSGWGWGWRASCRGLRGEQLLRFFCCSWTVPRRTVMHCRAFLWGALAGLLPRPRVPGWNGWLLVRAWDGL